MKFFMPILFLLVVIGAQVYVSYRIWHILPLSKLWKNILTTVYNCGLLACIIFFLIAFKSGEIINFTTTKVIYEIGTSSIFILLYLVMVFAAIDILRLVHFLPKNFVQDSLEGTIGVTAIMLILFVGGNIHYHNKYRETIDLTSTKRLPKPLKIVMLSDLHLGYHNDRSDFEKWIKIINEENPDLILIGGDIVDFSTVPLKEQNIAEAFHELKAPVYACLGNHEYIGGATEADSFYHKAGINLLQDEVAKLPQYGIAIVGRDDRTNKDRKDLKTLLQGKGTDQFYTIELDHQPYHLEEAEQNGIDFQFSGHTHYGQVWPITHIIDAMYECGFGPYQKGKTRYYVSSGMGIWGGKFRIGTRSEYLVAELHN